MPWQGLRGIPAQQSTSPRRDPGDGLARGRSSYAASRQTYLCCNPPMRGRVIQRVLAEPEMRPGRRDGTRRTHGAGVEGALRPRRPHGPRVLATDPESAVVCRRDVTRLRRRRGGGQRPPRSWPVHGLAAVVTVGRDAPNVANVSNGIMVTVPSSTPRRPNGRVIWAC